MVLVRVAEEELRLTAARAIEWPAARTLFIADAHLGKAATFRAAGVPIPEQTTASDLERLGDIVDDAGTEHLVVLGDLVHARSGRDAAFVALDAWRRERPSLAITLVRGNHDRSAGDPPPSLDVTCVEPGTTLGPFRLHHEPEAIDPDAGYAMAGHVHPAVVLRAGDRGSSARLPAFLLGPQRALLPAFGAFTGSKAMSAAPRDRVFVIADDEVHEVERRLVSRRGASR